MLEAFTDFSVTRPKIWEFKMPEAPAAPDWSEQSWSAVGRAALPWIERQMTRILSSAMTIARTITLSSAGPKAR